MMNNCGDHGFCGLCIRTYEYMELERQVIKRRIHRLEKVVEFIAQHGRCTEQVQQFAVELCDEKSTRKYFPRP